MAYRIEVNQDECIACGICEATCPEIFKAGDDGKSTVLKPLVEELGCAEEAANSCPVQCITITET